MPHARDVHRRGLLAERDVSSRQGIKRERRIHHYRVQSVEKLQQRQVWHSIYSAALRLEVLKLDSGRNVVRWGSIVRHDLVR